MGKGSYLGGSSMIRTRASKIDAQRGYIKKQKRRLPEPGLHVLPEEERIQIFEKVKESRRACQARLQQKQRDEAARKRKARESIFGKKK
jgi:hypothetical protein